MEEEKLKPENCIFAKYFIGNQTLGEGSFYTCLYTGDIEIINGEEECPEECYIVKALGLFRKFKEMVKK